VGEARTSTVAPVVIDVTTARCVRDLRPRQFGPQLQPSISLFSAAVVVDVDGVDGAAV